jgi:hypothetical protein
LTEETWDWIEILKLLKFYLLLSENFDNVGLVKKVNKFLKKLVIFFTNTSTDSSFCLYNITLNNCEFFEETKTKIKVVCAFLFN